MKFKYILVAVLFLACATAAVARDVIITVVPISKYPGLHLIGHNIYQATKRGGPYTKINTHLIRGTRYVVHHLGPGTYYFIANWVFEGGAECPIDESEVVVIVVRSNCDVNYDGVVDEHDLELEKDVILGKKPCPAIKDSRGRGNHRLSCDVNRDGKVNVLDLQIVANVVNKTASCTE